MPFPTNTSKLSLSVAWVDTQSRAAFVRIKALELRDGSAAGVANAKHILDFMVLLVDAKAKFEAAAALPGIAVYARNQLDDTARDVVAEFSTMVTTMTAVHSWIVNNFPKDVSGSLLALEFTPDGKFSYRIFTAGQTATLRTALNALIATIE